MFLPSSCDNKKDVHLHNVIPVASTVGNYNILKISDFASEIKYIPLETNDSVLISPVILQVICENEKILILDVTSANKNNCYLFDSNGKFCCRIGQYGQGPNDYLQINNVSMHDNFIFLMAWHKILIYDTNGHLIENINLHSNEIPDEYRVSNIRSIIPLKKDAYVVNVVTSQGDYPTAFLFKTNLSSVETIKEYPSSIKLDRMGGGFNSIELGSMYRFKDHVRIYKPVNDTIFSISQNTEMKEVFIFELGQYKPALSYFESKDMGDVLQWIKQSNNLYNKFIFVKTIYESNNHLFIKFNFGNHAPEPFEKSWLGQQFNSTEVCGLFNKFTGELTLMKQPVKGKLGFRNDLDNGPVIFPNYLSSKNELVTFITVEDFLDYYDKIEKPTPQITEIAKKINFDDNQIVIVAKLKE